MNCLRQEFEKIPPHEKSSQFPESKFSAWHKNFQLIFRVENKTDAKKIEAELSDFIIMAKFHP
jgi:hypothetical protein